MSEAPNRTALYPGSFDLLTNGHLNIIERASRLFDRLYVAVGVNPKKNPLFTLEERLAILGSVTEPWPNVEPVQLRGLTVHMAERLGTGFIVRGLRAVSDFDFELQMATTNHELNGGVETIFLAALPEHVFLSSSTIKEVWRNGGDIAPFVPPATLNALRRKHGYMANADDMAALEDPG